MMLRASECYAKKRAWHSAAKTLEQAMAIDQKRVREEGRKTKEMGTTFLPSRENFDQGDLANLVFDHRGKLS